MPYQSRADLPDGVKHVLPSHAQAIYLAAFNRAWDEYKNAKDCKDDTILEETAHKVAWSAVKQKYEKRDDERWHAKS